jgi:hypothetical protein
VRQIQHGDERVARAETTLLRPDGRSQKVHLYEAYWAPLTENQISSRETFWFLLRAGLAGAGRSLSGSWWRMMFGHRHEFELSKRALLAFLVAVLVLLSLLLMNGVILATTANRLLTVSASHWPSPPRFADLTADFLFCLSLSLLFSLGVVVVNVQRKLRSDGRVAGAPAFAVGLGWMCVWAIVAVVLATGGMVAYHLGHRYAEGAAPTWSSTFVAPLVNGLATPDLRGRQIVGAVVTWGLLVFMSDRVRWFVQQFVGDVAIYVSSHIVNRFFQVREQIHKAVNRIARFVYEDRDEAGEFVYEQVVAIGHSLGSVIVYDAVNAMIRDDNTQGNGLRVVERTPLLITSGSPLDKTAFIFRNQSKDVGDIREALAQSMQPMISDYHTRPQRWVNLFTPNDWICGSLECYNDASRPKNDPQHVQNVEDLQATTPLLAHNQYWNGEAFGDLLYHALVPAQAPAPPAG